ncbi:MAG: hypothetical protein AAF376_10310 [Pseudomonadota bacterium]
MMVADIRMAMAALLGLAFVIMAQPSLAQPVAVQSGEHPGFTRLVLDIGADRTFEIEQVDQTARVSFDPVIPSFDIARVFDLIPRTRLSGLTASDGLQLDLACACGVSAARFQERYLVIDVADTPVAPEIVPPSTVDEAHAQARRLAAAEALPDLTELVLNGSDATEQALLTPPIDATPSQQPNIALEEAARLMAEQLARAAASGLLQVADGRPQSDADPIRPGPAPAVESTATPDPAPPLPTPPILAETALDVAVRGGIPSAVETRPLVCEAEPLDITSWSAGAGVDQGLGGLRQALYNDRDELVRSAVIVLAQHYLYYGFGAEASFWLDQLDTPPLALGVIARLVDDLDDPHTMDLPPDVACHESALIWQVLDHPDAIDLTPEQIGRLQRQVTRLPIPLRDQLAPQVARFLHGQGAGIAARNIRDMLARGGRISDADQLHLDLDLGMRATRDADGTRDALALALRDDGASPARSMAQAIRFDRDMGVPISQARLDAGEAMLREFAVGPGTDTLWKQLVLAQADARNIDRVLMLLSDVTRRDGIRDATLTDLFAGRLEAEDTVALLILARSFGDAWTAQGSAAGRARVGTIAHLRRHGFVEAAEMLRDRQRLLILPTRPSVDDAPVNPLMQAWQSEDWATLADIADGAHADLALRMQATPEIPRQPDTTDLSDLVETVSDTRALRSTVMNLLNNPEPAAPQAAGGR